MSGFRARLNRVQKAIDTRGPWKEEIYESVRQKVYLLISTLAYNIRKGKPIDWCDDMRRIWDAYDVAPGDPDWRPRKIMDGFEGSPGLDAVKVKAAVEVYLEIYGWPHEPIQVWQLLSGGDGHGHWPDVEEEEILRTEFRNVTTAELEVMEKKDWSEEKIADFVRRKNREAEGDPFDPDPISMAGPPQEAASTPPEITGDEHASD